MIFETLGAISWEHPDFLTYSRKFDAINVSLITTTIFPDFFVNSANKDEAS